MERANSEDENLVNKNIVDSSALNTQGGDIKIGDSIYSPTSVIINNASGNKIYIILLVLSIIIFLYLFLCRYNVPSELQKEVSPLPINSVSTDEKNQNEKQKKAYNQSNSRVIESSVQDISEEVLQVQKANTDDAGSIKRYLIGETAKMPGNDSIQSFRMNQFEVTVGQYFAFCKATKRNFPHHLVDTLKSEFPMNHISWYDAEEYCHYVGGRLPTTKEWNWVIIYNFGTSTSDSKSIIADSWNRENSHSQTHPVGEKAAFKNISLYDMFGNLEEWCSDGPKDGVKYTKGGNFNQHFKNLDASMAGYSWAARGSEVIGFRVIY